jgi:hypothetical protein
MTDVLALVRPDDWNLALLFHVAGAMVLVGALVLAATALADNGVGSLRLGYRSLLIAALPSWLVMRVAAQWVLDESGFDEEEGWIGIGFITSELGLLLLIAATVCAGIAVRRGERPGLQRASLVLTSLLIVMYVVTIWAMTDKPS